MAPELARNLARRRLEQSLGGEGDGLVAREFREDAARVLPKSTVALDGDLLSGSRDLCVCGFLDVWEVRVRVRVRVRVGVRMRVTNIITTLSLAPCLTPTLSGLFHGMLGSGEG